MTKQTMVYMVIYEHKGDCSMPHVWLFDKRRDAKKLYEEDWVEGKISLVRGFIEASREASQGQEHVANERRTYHHIH